MLFGFRWHPKGLYRLRIIHWAKHINISSLLSVFPESSIKYLLTPYNVYRTYQGVERCKRYKVISFKKLQSNHRDHFTQKLSIIKLCVYGSREFRGKYLHIPLNFAVKKLNFLKNKRFK